MLEDSTRKDEKHTGDETHRAAELFDEVDAEIQGTKARASPEGRAEVERLRRSYWVIETLLYVSTSINSSLNLEEMLEKIVDAVVEITGCNRGYLMLAEGNKLSVALARSKEKEALSHKSFDVSLSVINKAAETGKPQLVSNAQAEADLRDKRSIVDFNIRTVICIPLKFEDNLVGVIYADSDSVSEVFEPSDLSILKAFGAQAAVAIENARSRGELERIKSSLEKQNVSLREQLAERHQFSGMVGRSRAMQEIFEVIKKVAPLSTTVLIQGETGTGKELIARAIHYNSDRKGAAMVSVNCGALPKHILESELFGYRRGAFTGADADRAGLFEAADGGTLFLDEIGEMPVDLQVKLLRALQDGEVRRLGEEGTRRVDVRVIAATNKNLKAEVETGNFRKDLYFRLNVVPISLPPLRDRPEDILALTEFFLEKYAKKMKRPKQMLTRPAKEMLLGHSWAGNVRELENAIERALALGEGRNEIDVDQFDHLVEKQAVDDPSGRGAPLKSMLLLWEKDFIRKVLIRNSWNVSKTATDLKISRQQLHSKIKKYSINPEI